MNAPKATTKAETAATPAFTELPCFSTPPASGSKVDRGGAAKPGPMKIFEHSPPDLRALKDAHHQHVIIFRAPGSHKFTLMSDRTEVGVCGYEDGDLRNATSRAKTSETLRASHKKRIIFGKQ